MIVCLAGVFCLTRVYANGKEPVIEELDVYRIEIPYVPTLQGSEIDTTQITMPTAKFSQKYGSAMPVWTR